jgi:hypothetical protein
MPHWTADTLLNLGFRDIAAWVTSSGNGGIDYRMDGPNPPADRVLLGEVNSLYAFVHGDRVMYIGKTARNLRDRIAGYRNPHVGQRTNWRCNGNIRDMLKRNEVLRIFVFNPIPKLRYGDFDINLAAGLEDSLIAEFDPPWNGRERGVPSPRRPSAKKQRCPAMLPRKRMLPYRSCPGRTVLLQSELPLFRSYWEILTIARVLSTLALTRAATSAMTAIRSQLNLVTEASR